MTAKTRFASGRGLTFGFFGQVTGPVGGGSRPRRGRNVVGTRARPFDNDSVDLSRADNAIFGQFVQRLIPRAAGLDLPFDRLRDKLADLFTGQRHQMR